MLLFLPPPHLGCLKKTTTTKKRLDEFKQFSCPVSIFSVFSLTAVMQIGSSYASISMFKRNAEPRNFLTKLEPTVKKFPIVGSGVSN